MPYVPMCPTDVQSNVYALLMKFILALLAQGINNYCNYAQYRENIHQLNPSKLFANHNQSSPPYYAVMRWEKPNTNLGRLA